MIPFSSLECLSSLTQSKCQLTVSVTASVGRYMVYIKHCCSGLCSLVALAYSVNPACDSLPPAHCAALGLEREPGGTVLCCSCSVLYHVGRSRIS